MNEFSSYVFRETLRPLLAICASLIAITILTEGLAQLDIIISNRNAGGAYFWVTLLVLPQDLTLIIPLAVFAAVTYALNRMRSESEIAVAFSAGVSIRRIARPIIILATLVALAHLAINAIVQPLASREMRDILYSLRSDIAVTLVRDSTFTSPTDGVVFYARDRSGAVMRDVFIDDTRSGRELAYTAKTGTMVTLGGKPAMQLRTGQVHRMNKDGIVEVLDFDLYSLSLDGIASDDNLYVVKPTDRNLYGLFLPDLTSFNDQRNVKRLLAEGHGRLASPLLDIALAMIGVLGALGGETNRRGRRAQIIVASCCAIGVRLLAIAVQAASIDNAALNAAQYALPLGVILVTQLLTSGPLHSVRRRSSRPVLIGPMRPHRQSMRA